MCQNWLCFNSIYVTILTGERKNAKKIYKGVLQNEKRKNANKIWTS